MVRHCLSFQRLARLGIAANGGQLPLEESLLELDEYGVQSRVAFIVARQWGQMSVVGPRVEEARHRDSSCTRR